jgi:phosphohistidine swiveling domain-containing protein
MTNTLEFGEAGADDVSNVGGKGVNLSRLAKAHFPVPPGFLITTNAYSEFIAANDLSRTIELLLGRIDFSSADQLEAITADIRALITSAPMPAAVAREIISAYEKLGTDLFVAVRSSGTAEDLAFASFAGQHDTYLDIRGANVLLVAVQRCWASLWTARAVSYRQRGGFRHTAVCIAVVVQVMIESDVSGVMFTANPMTARVDEYIVNASWGLGEAIVSGIVTPDLFVLSRDDMSVKTHTAGSKLIKIVRAVDRDHGTCQENVAAADQTRFCLTDNQLSELGMLGARVTEYYEGYPQDIEWALAKGSFYLLQSRDVTGVEFSWDEDLDDFQTIPQSDETVWTRAWSDGVWTGAVTPLMYSFRCENGQINRVHFSKIWGIDWGGERRVYKYHKGFVYYNCKTDYTGLKAMLHPAIRRDQLFEHLPPEWRKTIVKEPFSWTQLLGMGARIALLSPEHLPWNCWKHNYEIISAEAESAHGLPVEQIRRMTDKALVKYATSRIDAEPTYFQNYLDLFYLHTPIAMGCFQLMVEQWCGEKDPSVVASLLTGSPHQSITVKENRRLQELAKAITGSPLLTQLFKQYPGATFFAEVEKRPETRAFRDEYKQFISDYGHRGHADRDIYFDRRAESPGLDYAALQSMLDVDFAASAEKAKGVVTRRLELTEWAIAKIKKLPFGDLRAQLFMSVQNWLLQFWAFRDDERAHADKITFSIKTALLEVGRRIHERGLVEKADDFYFFSKNELFELFLFGKSNRLTREKVIARRRNHERFKKEFFAPMYMVGDRYANLEESLKSDDPNVLRGLGTSRGTISGVARVIGSQKDIGRVQKDEILITAATDPGWTPVFMVISGLVLETGGMLAHGSLLSREYGIPAVQVADAMKRIRDGQRITVNGDTGEVHIDETVA